MDNQLKFKIRPVCVASLRNSWLLRAKCALIRPILNLNFNCPELLEVPCV